MSTLLRIIRNLFIVAAGTGIVALAWVYRPVATPDWSASEIELLRSLSLDSLPPLPPDFGNAVSDDPQAALLGNRLFFDTRFSANGEVSCATCHQPDKLFTDGLQKGRGIGESKRHTRSIVGAAYSPWLYWDGRRDSLWSQALSPIEDEAEHGSNRMHVVRLVSEEATYREMYAQVFGPLPDFSDINRFPRDAAPAGKLQDAWAAMQPSDQELVNRVFSNIGKAIAAYERTLAHDESRFDRYVRALVDGNTEVARVSLTKPELLGLQLFMGKARCIECHNGPLFTNEEFHNTGVISFPGELPDRGRIDGVREVTADEFNCMGPYSDAKPGDCAELRFVRRGPELIGATRTPSLRGLNMTAPYMHKGQFSTLSEVLQHYNRAADAMIGHNEAEPLYLTWAELGRLEAFLESLAPAGVAGDLKEVQASN